MNQTAKQLLVVLIGLCISTLTTYAQVILSNGASAGPDIEMAAVLCDTETLEVPSFSGCGTSCNDECLNSKSITETNSIWLGWVAGNAAELTFTITPNNPATNIDFVLYELDRNPRDFSNNTLIRCSASTRTGPTGLRSGDTEFEEESTNDAANDGFLAPFFQIQQGLAYGLLIHSSDDDNGFTIEFGGEATFTGPAPDFDRTFSGCFDDPVTYLTLPDANGFDSDQIISYEWDFGEGATPADTILTVDEPIIVEYDTLGTKTVTLTVETDAGCRVTKTIENIIDVQACCGGPGEMDTNQITVDTSIVRSVSCPSDLDGTIQIAVNSRLAHTVQWTTTTDDFTSMEETLTGLGPNTYKVVVTNTAQCKDSLSVQLSAPGALSATVATPFVTQCDSDMGGSILVQATGGRQPYTYNYGLAQATQDFIDTDSLVGVDFGAYEITVRDDTGCETKDTAFVQPLNIEATAADFQNTKCRGDSTGSVTIETFSGAAPFAYDFGNGLSGGEELLTALPTGDYVVTITDANQCTGTLQEFSIEAPTDFGAFIDGGGFMYECFGEETASLTVEPTGGLTPYEYIWSTGATTKDISNLKADIYSVTVTDANGCIAEDEGNILQPDSLVTTILEASNASCFDSRDGRIKLSVIGGTGAYEWSLNDSIFLPFPSDSLFTSLSPQNYSIVIRDENGCEAVAVDTTLISPAEIVVTDSTTLATCRGGRDGSIIINATGGMAPYTFEFASTPAGFSATNNTGRIDTVPIGIYTVLITDANGCTQPVNGIEVSELELIIDTVGLTNLACSGENAGAVELSIENNAAAQAPFLYDIFDGNGLQGDSILTTLAAGDYTIDVYDANGCQGTSPAFTIEEPLVPLTISPNFGNINCFGAADGSAIIIPSGGTPDYTIAWSTGDTVRQINDLDIGDYSVTVTDANGCSEEAAFTITQNDPIAISEINPIPVDCPDDPSGAIGFDLQGGIAPYQYSLDDGDTFQDLMVDGDSATITELVAGDYVISIIDAENCTATVTGSVTSPAMIEPFVLGGGCYGEPVSFSDFSTFTKGEIINWTWDFGAGASIPNATGPGPHDVVYTTIGTPEVTLTLETDLGCVVTHVVNGMDNPDSFILEPCCDINAVNLTAIADSTSCADMPDGQITLDIETPDNAPIVTIDWDTDSVAENTEILPNLGVGTYEVTVTNQATCTATTSTVIASPEALLSIASKTDPSCGGISDGIISVTTTGGTGPFTYSFGADFQEENIIEDLSVGNYDVFIQDANNCRDQVSVSLAEKELITEGSITNFPNCFGEATGAIAINIPNGTAPYQYNLNGAGLEDAAILLNLAAGNYSIEIVDAEQCIGNIDVIMTQPEAVTVNLVGNMISCFGETDGRLIATPAGGDGNFTYSWRNEANQVVSTEAIAENLPQGNYFLTLTDDQGCDTTEMGLVVEPPELLAVANVQNALCAGEANGAIIPQGVGGTPPYAYSQDGILFFQTEIIPNLAAGDYTILVRDAGGCEAETSAIIDEPGAFTIITSQDLDINLGTEVQLEAIVSDPTGVNFLWTGPDSLSCNNCPNPRLMPSQSGTYTITATTDQGDCTATETINIAVNFDRPVYIPTAFSPNGDGINDNFYIAGGPAVENIVRLSIFDRFGNLLYDQTNIAAGDPTIGWDGRFNGDRMHTGVYVIKADIQFIDGELITYTRDLTLISN